jgi:hypothetical protein
MLRAAADGQIVIEVRGRVARGNRTPDSLALKGQVSELTLVYPRRSTAISRRVETEHDDQHRGDQP